MLQLLVVLALAQLGALLLGDVDHRAHPAAVAAVGVDEPRGVDHGDDLVPVAVPQARLEARARGLPAHHGLVVEPVLRHVVGVPVGVRRQPPQQLVGAVAGHLAEGRVDVDDAALQVARAHADEQRVFHRLAEGVGLVQLVGALAHAQLQVAPRVALLGEAALAQPPVQRAQQQHAGAQQAEHPGALARAGDFGVVGHHRQGPAQVGQGLVDGEKAARLATDRGAHQVARRVLDGFNTPRQRREAGARAVLLVVFDAGQVGGAQRPRGLVHPARHRAQEHDAARVGQQDRVAHEGPGVVQLAQADLDGDHAQHLAAALGAHRRRHEQPRLARGLAHAVEQAAPPGPRIEKVRPVGVRLAHEALRRGPVARGQREALRVGEVQRVGAGEAVHFLDVVVGALPRGGVLRVGQHGQHVGVHAGGERQVAVLAGGVAQAEHVHFHGAADRVGLEVRLAPRGPLAGHGDQQQRQRHGARPGHQRTAAGTRRRCRRRGSRKGRFGRKGRHGRQVRRSGRRGVRNFALIRGPALSQAAGRSSQRTSCVCSLSG
ncbi:hypothetical protein FQZ97_431530 [compost metagenome]